MQDFVTDGVHSMVNGVHGDPRAVTEPLPQTINLPFPSRGGDEALIDTCLSQLGEHLDEQRRSRTTCH